MAEVSEESACNAGGTGDAGFIPGLGRSLEKQMATHSRTLAWEIPRRKGALAGYSPKSRKGSGTTEQLSMPGCYYN